MTKQPAKTTRKTVAKQAKRKAVAKTLSRPQVSTPIVQGKDYLGIAHSYMEGVASGKIPACKYVRAAIERQYRDLEKDGDPDFGYRFDLRKAERVCKVVEMLPHIKGKWSGTKIILEPWQIFILTSVFGWVSIETGTRRFRIVYIEVPRKNAKSTLTAAVGVYMLALDGEGGAECYSAATTRDQAKIVFETARQMVKRDRDLCSTLGLSVNAHNIAVLSTASKFEALSAEGSTLDGLNTHFASIDELHAHKSRAVYDVVETSTAARTQSLLWNITTAGFDRSGICYEQRTYVTKILEQVAVDETYFGIIYTIDEGDDWTHESSWAKANPNYGVSVNPGDIARLCRKAQEMPSAVNNFLTKHLDVWVNANIAWMDMRAWDRCKDESLKLNNFAKKPVYIGLDLASKIDMAAKAMLFPYDKRVEGKMERHYALFTQYYLPQRAIDESRNSQYGGWARDGRLTVTPGDIIDFDYIKEDIRMDASNYDVRAVPYDPFQATELSTSLLSEGFPMIELRPTVLNFSEPMKLLEALVLSGRIHHDGCPITAWMMSNVVAHLDVKDNIYPRKERPENKIDGVVAAISALARAIVDLGEGPSIYHQRGVRAF